MRTRPDGWSDFEDDSSEASYITIPSTSTTSYSPHFFHAGAARPIRPGQGKSIDHSKVVPSISRPVWEPPALEVLDAFETKAWEKKDKDMRRVLRDVGKRTEYLNGNREYIVLGRYYDWVQKSGRAAIAVGDEEREAFYEKLLKELKIEFGVVWEEMTDLLREHGDREIFMEVSGMEWEEIMKESESVFPSRMFTLRPSPESTEAASSVDWSLDVVDRPARSDTESLISYWSFCDDYFDEVYNLDVLFNDYNGPTNNPRAFRESSTLEEGVTSEPPPFIFGKFTEQVV